MRYCVQGNEKRPTAAAICSKAGYFFGRTRNLGSIALLGIVRGAVGHEGEHNCASRLFSDLLQARMKFIQP